MNATKTKRIQRTTLAHRRLYIVVAKLTMMVFYVCVYSEAREANEREKKNFLFFVKRETKRRKNIKNGSQKRKNSKILFFLLFFCALDGRPKHLQILGHLHAHRYSIHFFSLKISLCFVR